jgi:tRNA1(Val) A37 N6-methylase TrmN6
MSDDFYISSIANKSKDMYMTLWQFFRHFACISLYTACTIASVGCATSPSTDTDDNESYATWEMPNPGKFKLIWYYTTKDDFIKNNPGRALVGDKQFITSSDVRPPTINSIYLLEHSYINEGDEVLDVGTGCGIHAIFSADKAKRIVATDIYEPAIENAKTNAQLNGVLEKIDFRLGDLFGPIKDDEKFDAIYFNINFPFKHDSKDRTLLHERFFAEVRKYMKPNARIYFQTNFIKNFPYIYDMLNRNRFRIMEMHAKYILSQRHEPVFMMIQSL